MKSIILLLLILITVSLGAQGAEAQDNGPCRMGFDNRDPRNPGVICFPILGTMEGLIHCKLGGEQFGRNIYPVGDVNHDSLQDFIVGRIRCDTLITIDSASQSERFPEEILLYRGVRGGLPAVSSGERIGPSEVGSSTAFLASGDWDGDGNVDIATRIAVYGDTSYGNRKGAEVANCVIFWGQPTGRFTINDTTRLSGDADGWQGPRGALSADFDHDGNTDLLLWNGYNVGLTAGQLIRVPVFFLYQGRLHRRWGREISNKAIWRWWTPPNLTHLGPALIDHDGDGNSDIILYDNNSGGLSHLSILYGHEHSLPDTTDLHTVDLTVALGRYSLLQDITGDGIPELLVHTGVLDERVKVYAGIKGQRLKEQFGTGNEPPHPDSARWWGRPWAEIWLPNRVDSTWFQAHAELLDLGDGNGDGIGDIWAYSWPFIFCYSGGKSLDSLADAMLDTRPASQPGARARLGDIDGSGTQTLAFGTGNAIVFFKPSKAMPTNGRARRLPEGTGPAAVELAPSAEQNMLFLRAIPNPTRDILRLTWNRAQARGTAIITLASTAGTELRHVSIPSGDGATAIATAGLPRGEYFVTLRIGAHATTIPVAIR